MWIPLPQAGGIARLEAESRLSESEGDLLDLGPPLARVPDSPLPSDVLAQEREHER
jgi:hypothetical protein